LLLPWGKEKLKRTDERGTWQKFFPKNHHFGRDSAVGDFFKQARNREGQHTGKKRTVRKRGFGTKKEWTSVGPEIPYQSESPWESQMKKKYDHMEPIKRGQKKGPRRKGATPNVRRKRQGGGVDRRKKRGGNKSGENARKRKACITSGKTVSGGKMR